MMLLLLVVVGAFFWTFLCLLNDVMKESRKGSKIKRVKFRSKGGHIRPNVTSKSPSKLTPPVTPVRKYEVEQLNRHIAEEEALQNKLKNLEKKWSQQN